MFAWDDLKYFLAFAREGSMQGAAKALGVRVPDSLLATADEVIE